MKELHAISALFFDHEHVKSGLEEGQLAVMCTAGFGILARKKGGDIENLLHFPGGYWFPVLDAQKGWICVKDARPSDPSIPYLVLLRATTGAIEMAIVNGDLFERLNVLAWFDCYPLPTPQELVDVAHGKQPPTQVAVG